MFTGIIEDVGTVNSIEKKGSSGRIKIRSTLDLHGVAIGDSIAVNGACLTVTGIAGDIFEADVSEETLNLTTLGDIRPNEAVNLEKALTLNKPLGGHLVTGHVDGVGTVVSRNNHGSGSFVLEIKVAPELIAQIVKKGSITVDGISLTIADLTDDTFKAAIIPHTLKKTTLSLKEAGAKVNVETDVIGKYVEKYFAKSSKGVTEGFLAEHGFLGKRKA